METLSHSVGPNKTNERADVRKVQRLLNRFCRQGTPLLKVDGLVGPKTLAGITGFQRSHLHMAQPDQTVDPGGPTIRALSVTPHATPSHAPQATAKPAISAAPGSAGPKSSPTSRPTAAATPAAGSAGGARMIAWGAKVSPVFKQKAIAISERLGVSPDFLMSCMAFESGESFSASVPNAAGSGAVGLIQFMPSTARGLHTTTAALAAMTPEQQLDYVERYFQPHANRLHSIEDIYMTILYPKAIGQSTDYVLFRRGTTAYRQNSGLDRDTDGNVTVFEAAAAVRAKYHKGLKSGFIG